MTTKKRKDEDAEKTEEELAADAAAAGETPPGNNVSETHVGCLKMQAEQARQGVPPEPVAPQVNKLTGEGKHSVGNFTTVVENTDGELVPAVKDDQGKIVPVSVTKHEAVTREAKVGGEAEQ
jgi:hypothetical protein